MRRTLRFFSSVITLRVLRKLQALSPLSPPSSPRTLSPPKALNSPSLRVLRLPTYNRQVPSSCREHSAGCFLQVDIQGVECRDTPWSVRHQNCHRKALAERLSRSACEARSLRLPPYPQRHYGFRYPFGRKIAELVDSNLNITPARCIILNSFYLCRRE